jgi:drug/metabolite transporter (DMT)-like permease
VTGESASSQRRRLILYFLMVLTMLLWGGTFSAGKLASQGAGPISVAFFRFLISALFLFPQHRLMEGHFLPRKNSIRVWILIALSALTGLVLYNYFFIRGLALTGAGRGSVIVATNPALVYVGTVIFFHERLTLVRLLGIVLAVIGTIVVVSSGNPLSLLQGAVSLGDVFMVACVLSWACYALLGKLLLAEISPVSANLWTTIVSLVFLLPLLFLSHEDPLAFLHFSSTTWLSIGFLGVCGTVLGFTFFYYGILNLGPNRASVFVSLVPFFAILCGAIIFGESISPSIVIGLILSLMGLTIIQRY